MKLHYIFLEKYWKEAEDDCPSEVFSLLMFHKAHLKLSQPTPYEMMVCEL